MSKKTRIIILSVLAVLIVVVLSVSITTAFMKPIDQGGNITEVSLSSCAKIKLEGTTSIKLTNSYPMSRNKGLQTTPYTFTVTSYCDSYVGFNLYLATLSTNTLAASNIHYIITEKGSKEALVEGTLTSSLDDASNFTDAEKTELNAGLSGTYGNIFKLYNNKVPYKGSATYDLYLFVDEKATEYQNTTFAAGVAVKSYERERDILLADYVKSLYTGTQGTNNIYYHDASLTNGAGDNSYRYAGASDQVNNYVCFGSTTTPCPADNLYRIIGVFDTQVGENQTEQRVKLIKSASVGEKAWDTNNKNTWSTSSLNTYLNNEFISTFDDTTKGKIATTTWKVGGNTYANIRNVIPATAYQNEIVSPVTTNTSDNATEYKAKIGLMYASDYGFAAAPSAWTTNLYDYDGAAIKNANWMFLGVTEWTISHRADNSSDAFYAHGRGYLYFSRVALAVGVRPVFSLTSSVNYASGSGSATDPILVN